MPTQEMSAAWLFTAMAVGAVGAGYLLYGWRQRDAPALIVGVALSVAPLVLGQAWVLLLLSVLLMAGHATRHRWLP